MSNVFGNSPSVVGPVPQFISRGERFTVVGLALALISVVIGVLAWQFPRSPDDPAGGSGPATEGSTGRDGTPPANSPVGQPSKAPPRSTFLDTFAAQVGGANVVTLPRDLNGQPGYDHAVAIRCPSNQNDDKVREVNYLLRGRYLTFSAMVRPYFPAERDAIAHVYVLAAARERDGTLTWATRGSQFNATMSGPAPITAEVEGMQEMTLQVRCEYPEGIIILTNAAVTSE